MMSMVLPEVRMHWRKKVLSKTLIVLAVLGAFLVPGCAAVAVGAAAGAGGLAYAEGRERRTFAVTIETAWEAILSAVETKGIQITSQTRTPGSGEVNGRWGVDNDGVRIYTKAVGSGSTMIGVRVGVAEKSRNLELMRAIEAAMPPGTPPSVAYD